MRTLAVILLVALAIVLFEETSAAQTPECEFGESKKENCNNCFCTAGRVWACTKRTCGIHKREIRLSHTPECTVGDAKTEDCNRCRCVGYGKWACTRMRCIHKRELDCTPGQITQNRYKICICTSEGISVCAHNQDR